jgi:hypothetical protein
MLLVLGTVTVLASFLERKDLGFSDKLGRRSGAWREIGAFESWRHGVEGNFEVGW